MDSIYTQIHPHGQKNRKNTMSLLAVKGHIVPQDHEELLKNTSGVSLRREERRSGRTRNTSNHKPSAHRTRNAIPPPSPSSLQI